MDEYLLDIDNVDIGDENNMSNTIREIGHAVEDFVASNPDESFD